MGGSDETTNELRKMIAFIAQEASEKAREVEIKADEEFNIEKAKIVRKETLLIEEALTKKIKLANTKRRIHQSLIVNSSRIKTKKALDDAFSSFLSEAKGKLAVLESAQSHTIISDLIKEAELKLDPDYPLWVYVRSKDVQAAQRAANNLPVPNRYNIQADDTIGYGGIIAKTKLKSQTCVNTFEKRLELVSENTLPWIKDTITQAIIDEDK